MDTQASEKVNTSETNMEAVRSKDSIEGEIIEGDQEASEESSTVEKKLENEGETINKYTKQAIDEAVETKVEEMNEELSEMQRASFEPVDISAYPRTPNDTNDPSYTNLALPYRVVCRQRYRQAGLAQRAQFIKEIKRHELLQSKALDGVRIHREFCNVIIRPISPEELIRLTDKQKARIEEILSRP